MACPLVSGKNRESTPAAIAAIDKSMLSVTAAKGQSNVFLSRNLKLLAI